MSLSRNPLSRSRRITPLKTQTKLTVETDALAAKVLRILHPPEESGQRALPEKIDHYLSEISDPEMLADLIAATFITDPAQAPATPRGTRPEPAPPPPHPIPAPRCA